MCMSALAFASSRPRHWRGALLKTTLVCAFGLAACGGGGSSSDSQQSLLLQSVVPQAPQPALAGRVIVGYQGWFGCPNDFAGNKNWYHWFDQVAAPGSI